MTMELAARPFGQKENPGPSRPATQVIAFLGTGRMGGPMAANLARAGFPGCPSWTPRSPAARDRPAPRR